MKMQRDITINNKNSNGFLKKLDLNIEKQNYRIEVIEELLQDEYWSKINNYIKVNITQDEALNTNNLVVKNLEKMANYILYAPDAERIYKKTQYNIYKNEEEFKKACRETCKENKILNFLLNQNYNYYVSTDLKLNKNDYKKEFIEDYNNYNKHLKSIINYGTRKIGIKLKKIYSNKNLSNEEKKLQIKILVKKNKYYTSVKKNIESNIDLAIKKVKSNKSISYTDKKKIISRLYNQKNNLTIMLSKWIGFNKNDAVEIKDFVDKIITFKHSKKNYSIPLDEINLINQIDLLNRKHVKELIKVDKKLVQNKNLLDILNDIYKYIELCRFDNFKISIIKLLRKDKSLKDIASILGTSSPNIHKNIDTIVDRIIKQYEEDFEENFYYLDVCRGTYKRCNICGQIKLIQRFDKNPNSRDGYRNECKSCRSNSL